jgi:hypothetical protein
MTGVSKPNIEATGRDDLRMGIVIIMLVLAVVIAYLMGKEAGGQGSSPSHHRPAMMAVGQHAGGRADLNPSVVDDSAGEGGR